MKKSKKAKKSNGATTSTETKSDTTTSPK
jgi:hypothetical protein